MIKKLGNRNVESIQRLEDRTIIHYENESVTYWNDETQTTSKSLRKFIEENDFKSNNIDWEKLFNQKNDESNKIQQQIKEVVKRFVEVSEQASKNVNL